MPKMAPTLGKSAKYKKQKLSSDVMAEILRSDDEDELVEFINNSFPQNGPGVANNNKRRIRTSNKAKEDEPMQEIDLNGVPQSSSGANIYDLSSNGESIILGDKPRSPRSRFFITFGLFISFFALGIAIAILGPSLLDLKDQVHSSFEGMSTVFTVRSVGYLLGSIVAGWLFDRWNGYFVLSLSCFVASVSLVVTPLTRSFFVLMAAISFQGLSLGSLDTGGNVLILNLYGKNSDAQMQGLHAMFGLGAFISPLLVGPFLTTTTSPTHHTNMTNSSFANSTITPTPATNLSSNYTSDAPHIIHHSDLRWPYIISMLFFIIPIITFVSAGFKESGRNQQASKPWENLPSNDQRAFKGFTLILLFLFLLLYVGMEVAIGGLIFSFAFKHGILKSKELSAYLTSTFWGSFCAGRFLSIPLSMYVRAYRILVIDLLGCILGACILVFISSSMHAWLWVGTALLGISMAAIFPSTMTWAETFMHISGKTASVLVVGASLGEMTIPLIFGSLMQRKGADVFVDGIMIVTVLATIVFILASLLARRQKKEQVNDFGIHYRKSTEQKSNHSIFSKGDEIVQLLEDSSEIFSVEN